MEAYFELIQLKIILRALCFQIILKLSKQNSTNENRILKFCIVYTNVLNYGDPLKTGTDCLTIYL